MKTFIVTLSAIFIGMSIFHQIFGSTLNAIWLAAMGSFWLALSIAGDRK